MPPPLVVVLDCLRFLIGNANTKTDKIIFRKLHLILQTMYELVVTSWAHPKLQFNEGKAIFAFT